MSANMTHCSLNGFIVVVPPRLGDGVPHPLHARQNPGLLIKHVQELVNVVNVVGTADLDLQIASRGILQEQVRLKVKKPELVVEDDLDI